jgi:hypothetical protein
MKLLQNLLVLLLTASSLAASKSKGTVTAKGSSANPPRALNLATEPIPLDRKRNARSIGRGFESESKNRALITSATYAPAHEPEGLLTLMILRKLFKLNVVVFGTLLVYNISHELGNPKFFPSHAIIAFIEALVDVRKRPIDTRQRLAPLLVDVLTRFDCFFLQCALAYSGALSKFPPDIVLILFITIIDLLASWLLLSIQ